MPYNLPKPWDPGYALPDNVDEEGLERRAFVTKQLPRGTYDNPAVGTGGYPVPQYVLDEGYGQGTYTTKWVPGGTYGGPRIPPWLNQHPQVTKSRRLPGGGRAVTMLSGFGDAELPAPFEDYGQRAAQILLSRVQSVPAKQRQSVLKQVMDKVDPSLWIRSQQIWKRYIAQGMTPAQALPLAIGRAMSTGLAAEVIDTGLRRSAPQAKSLLGLGCYGCMAVLGEDAPAAADCETYKGFSWVYGSAGVPGRWERTKAGAADVPACKTPPAGAATVDPSTADIRDHQATGAFYVGPFQFDDRLTNHTFKRGDPPDLLFPTPDLNWSPSAEQAAGTRTRLVPMNSDILAWLKKRLTEQTDDAGMTDKGTTYPALLSQMGDDELGDWQSWFDAIGVSKDTPLRMHTLHDLLIGMNPMARTKHPKTGENLELRLMIRQRANQGDPLALKVWLSRVPDPGILGSIWNTLVQIPATVVMPVRNAVVDTVKDLADLACDILKGPLAGPQGQAAGAAAAGAAGAPPQAGAVGAAIAQNACGAQAPPTPPVIPPKSSLMTTLLLAGGAVAAVALLTRDK